MVESEQNFEEHDNETTMAAMMDDSNIFMWCGGPNWDVDIIVIPLDLVFWNIQNKRKR